jgi:hypothetical protein
VVNTLGMMDDHFIHQGVRHSGMNVPRPFCATEVPDEANLSLSIIRQTLERHENIGEFLPLGLTILNIGFSPFFSIPAITILASKKLPMDIFSEYQESTPLVICHGRYGGLSDTGDVDEPGYKAMEILEAGHKGLDLRERMMWLDTFGRPMRAPTIPGNILHGTSIGVATGPESKGTAAVYLEPTESAGGFVAGHKYLLTAAHVVLPMSFPERLDFPIDDTIVRPTPITTPGRLDIELSIRRIEEYIFRDPTAAQRLVEAASTPCGMVSTGRIGVDEQGWREDWALISLEKEYEGDNGVFWDLEAFQSIAGDNQKISGDVFKVEVESGEDLDAGRLWYKDGAMTGWSAGQVNRQELDLFLKGTALPIALDYEEQGVHPENVVRAKVMLLEPVKGLSMAQGGDSGAAIFALTKDGKGMVWGGMVVSVYRPEHGQELVMAVSQSRILEQVKAMTGVNWKLS